MQNNSKIDVFGAEVIMALVAAFIGDVTFFLVLTHYFCGAFALGMFWHKANGFLAKLVLVLGFLLPLPFLTLSILLAILLSNRFVAIIVEQAAIQTIAAFTAGAGEALEGVAVGAEAAEAGGTILEAGEGISATVEAGSATAEFGAETAEVAGKTPASESTLTERMAQRAEQKARDHLLDRLNPEGDRGRDEDGEDEREEDNTYERLMETGAERPPMEQVEEELFSEEGPRPQNLAEQEQEAEKAAPKESEAMRRLRERFEKTQKVRQGLEGTNATNPTPENEGYSLEEAA